MKNSVLLLMIFVSQIVYSQIQDNMIFVPGGKYKYNGDTALLINSFYIDRTEVTIKQFEEFILATGYKTVADSLGYSIVQGGKQKKKCNLEM